LIVAAPEEREQRARERLEAVRDEAVQDVATVAACLHHTRIGERA
jgi:hypothetical protein